MKWLVVAFLDEENTHRCFLCRPQLCAMKVSDIFGASQSPYFEQGRIFLPSDLILISFGWQKVYYNIRLHDSYFSKNKAINTLNTTCAPAGQPEPCSNSHLAPVGQPPVSGRGGLEKPVSLSGLFNAASWQSTQIQQWLVGLIRLVKSFSKTWWFW